MGEVKVNTDNVNELWLNNEQFLAFDITKLFSQINFKADVNQVGFVLNVINLSTQPVQLYGDNIPTTNIAAKSNELALLNVASSKYTLFISNKGNRPLKIIESVDCVLSNNMPQFSFTTHDLPISAPFNKIYDSRLNGTFIIFNF